jgi:hypothetical protein
MYRTGTLTKTAPSPIKYPLTKVSKPMLSSNCRTKSQIIPLNIYPTIRTSAATN